MREGKNMEQSKNVQQSKRLISRPLEILLRMFGIWPGILYGVICKAFWLIVMITNTTLQYLFIILHARTANFTVLMYSFAATLALSMKLIKLIIFWSNQRMQKRRNPDELYFLMQMLSERRIQLNRYVFINTMKRAGSFVIMPFKNILNKIGAHHNCIAIPRLLMSSKFDEMWRAMSTSWKGDNVYTSTFGKTQASHYFANFIVAFSSMSVMLNSYSILLSGIHYDEASNGTRPYILMMHLPFDINRQSVYLLVMFLQFFYLLFLSAGAATLNSVLIILMLYLGDQIDVICRRLINMAENEHNANVTVVKDIIRKHQSVITFSKNIETLYTYIALMLVVLNTLITCGLAYLLVTAIGAPNFSMILMKNLMFYCAINIETFVFCFAGEYISAKSKEIGEAAYSSPWYQSKFHSHAVLILIMRSQHQLTITMGKFMDLSLERFSTIMKTSASYLSVLLAMY